ncbi:hypothetical protein CLORAM_03056 [Thomasclavelia ramosa DSM 1402]|uniref:Uncharacterized protein n=1 Tax=Thomasclavelia ramosa DSM 1402 TaxID=445974 RepID=B0N8S6_9FIRM|nr:hypothetical protein CLORAM_03056 [Thomasclavelia ramosa DSM 1402]
MCASYFYYTLIKVIYKLIIKNKYIFKNGKILSAGLYFMEIYARIKDNKLNY